MSNITFTESSGLNDSIFGKSQAPIRLFIEKRGEAFEQQSVIKALFAMSSSKHYAEKLTSLTGMDGFKAVGENGTYPTDMMQEGYSKTIEHMTWKDSFSLSREIIEDSKIIDLKKKPAAFINGYYRTREKFGAAIFGGAIAGSSTVSFAGKEFDITAADGENLFSEAHPAKLTNTIQSNMFADEFSVDALGMMEVAMQNFKGDNDENLDVAPDTILIPNVHSLKKAVFEAIGADKDPATSNNGYNYQFGRWTVIVWPYLNQFVTEGSTPWVLIDSRYNNEYGGAVWLDRTPLDVRSTIDEATDANIWRGYSRFSAGIADWRFACIGGAAGASKYLDGTNV